ncbi:MAG: glycine rich domain-containing protein, partial [Bacilli bacterium]
AGGGSGWIYNANSFSNWQSGNPTDASKWLLNSTYYLTEASTIDGNTNMPNHNGNSTMTGNTGNGYAKITLIK